MALPNTGSILVITPSADNGLTLPPFAGRGIKEDLEPIDMGNNVEMACSGREIDMTHAQFRKLQITLTWDDVRCPLMNKAWAGQTITVDCISERCYITIGGAADRPAVSGSIRVGTGSEAHLTFYRPQLVMVVKSIKHGKDEYGANYAGQLSAVELEVPTL